LITLTGQKQTIDISVMDITVDQNAVVVKYRLMASLDGRELVSPSRFCAR
jgi:hypothetical protein